MYVFMYILYMYFSVRVLLYNYVKCNYQWGIPVTQYHINSILLLSYFMFIPIATSPIKWALCVSLDIDSELELPDLPEDYHPKGSLKPF